MLKIEHLTKTYGDKKAVDDLSLHIKPGETYGFIVHNGAGKTTTNKSCCGILPFDAGEIFVDGIDLKADPMSCKRTLAYIPDYPDLYDFMTGILPCPDGSEPVAQGFSKHCNWRKPTCVERNQYLYSKK